MTRIVVTGGRDYDNPQHLELILGRMHAASPITELAQGECPTGADAMAKAWARSQGITVKEYAADWLVYGRSAGPVRNQFMLDDFRPDSVVAFPGNRGTADCVRRARKANLTVWVVRP